MRITSVCQLLALAAAMTQAQSTSVVLIDAYTGEPIANREVSFLQQVMCVRAPCPPLSAGTGRTDATGTVRIPKDVRSSANRITAEGYRDAEIPQSLQNRRDGNRIQLDPEQVEGTRLKLLDAASRQPIGNTEAALANDGGCHSASCATVQYRGRTNRLGNVYVPSKLLGEWYGDHRGLVLVQGYQAYVYPPESPDPSVLDLIMARLGVRSPAQVETESDPFTVLLRKR